jgi:hypothetical protein
MSGVPLVLQFPIALFTAMVAATFAPPVRKSIPTWVEVLLWVGLVAVCALGVMSVNEPHARELTASVVWAVDQILNTTVGLVGAGVLGWLSIHRFAIAYGILLLVGADILAITLIRHWRKGRGWQPRVRLREWMELPPPPSVGPRPAPASASAYALDVLMRGLAPAMARTGTAGLTWLIRNATWAREVLLPRQARRVARAAAAGEAGSRAGLEAIRDAAAELGFAARSWYTAAGAPAVEGFTARAVQAVKSAAAAQRARVLAGFGSDHVIDIQGLISAQSIGWYRPIISGLAEAALTDEEDGTGSDRLAS